MRKSTRSMISYRIVQIVLGITLLAWIILGVKIFSGYIDYSSIQETTKGGTFVESIYESISYLPYRGDPIKNHFYQTLLFPGCVGGLEGDLCDISTEDNKTYTVTIKTGHMRSDGVEFSIDDIILSYENIVINNMWNHSYLEPYADIAVSQSEDDRNTLIITFPTANDDNKEFFTLPLLPAHRIIELFEINDYVQSFSIDPIYLSCAFIKSSKDKNSLLIDMSRCTQTNINIYQIKLFNTLQDLSNHIEDSSNITSFYYGHIDNPYYEILPIQDNLFVTMFFNTKSTKLSPRIQRALGGFLHTNLGSQYHTGYMSVYTGLLSYHQSTGSNLDAFIREKNPSLSYDRVGLEQGGVGSLPRIFTIDWAKRKYAFYLDKIEEKVYSFTIETPDPVFDLKAKTDQSVRYLETTSENNNKKHTITFTIGANQQVIEGLNMITIGGTILGKKQEVANIDLYYLGTTSEVDRFDPLKIIMMDNKISNYIRLQLRGLFEQYGMSDLFEFIVYATREEFTQALQDNNYDMALSTIQMRGLSDIYAILSSTKSDINLSQYLNPVLNQYLLDENRPVVRDIFSTSMPFTIIGQLMKPYWIHRDLIIDTPASLPEKNLRHYLIRTISIVRNSQLDIQRLRRGSNFVSYIQSLHDTPDDELLDNEGTDILVDELIEDGLPN